jgi:hypothetical protein
MHQQKGYALLFAKFLHEVQLMVVDVAQGKAPLAGFLCVKANGQPLCRTDKVNGAFFSK